MYDSGGVDFMLLCRDKLREYGIQATDGVVGTFDGLYFIGDCFSRMMSYAMEWMSKAPDYGSEPRRFRI
jgi:hypothetical protein